MRQDESSTDEREALDAIHLDLELEDLLRFGQMVELSLVPGLPPVPHADKQRGELLLTCKRKAVRAVLPLLQHRSERRKLDSEHRNLKDQSCFGGCLLDGWAMLLPNGTQHRCCRMSASGAIDMMHWLIVHSLSPAAPVYRLKASAIISPFHVPLLGPRELSHSSGSLHEPSPGRLTPA